MEDKKAATRLRVIVFLLIISLIANVGLFFYGLINNIQMKKEREISIGLKVEVEKCITESIQMRDQLHNALEEARQAKDYAFTQAMAAKEASLNKK